jgi:CheY-like chemotaxis protein
VLEALHRIFPADRMTAVTADLKEPARIVECLCQGDAQLEKQSLEKISRICRIPLVAEPPEFDLTALPPAINKEKLLRAGVSLEIEAGELRRYFCVSPELVSLSISGLEGKPFALAPYRAIARALRLSALKQEFPFLHSVALYDFIKEFLTLATQHAVAKATLTLRAGEKSSLYTLERESGERAEGCTALTGLESVVTNFLETPHEVVFKYLDEISRLATALPVVVSIGADGLFVFDFSGAKSMETMQASHTLAPVAVKQETSNTHNEPAVPEQSLIQAPQPSVSNASLNEASPPKVLVVEDSESFRRILSRFLTRHGIEVHSAENGSVALQLLSDGLRPDLILSDFHMTVMNGEEFIKALRRQSHLKDLPVIVLTSDSEAEAEITLISSGAQCLLRKDVDSRVLLAYVKRHLPSTIAEAA